MPSDRRELEQAQARLHRWRLRPEVPPVRPTTATLLPANVRVLRRCLTDAGEVIIESTYSDSGPTLDFLATT